MLKVQALQRKIADFELQADFKVEEGERLAIIGPSGCGKTSLLRLLSGLETQDAGKIFLGEKDISLLPPEKRGIGMVFQDANLFPSMNVLDNVTFGLKIRGVPRAERDIEGREWLKRVGLQDFASAGVDRLSGGEKQRVAFIRAVIMKPKLMLLDEPFANLDEDTRGVMISELRALHALVPVPLVFVSHDKSEVSALATSVISCRVVGGIRAFYGVAE